MRRAVRDAVARPALKRFARRRPARTPRPGPSPPSSGSASPRCGPTPDRKTAVISASGGMISPLERPYLDRCRTWRTDAVTRSGSRRPGRRTRLCRSRRCTPWSRRTGRPTCKHLVAACPDRRRVTDRPQGGAVQPLPSTSASHCSMVGSPATGFIAESTQMRSMYFTVFSRPWCMSFGACHHYDERTPAMMEQPSHGKSSAWSRCSRVVAGTPARPVPRRTSRPVAGRSARPARRR